MLLRLFNKWRAKVFLGDLSEHEDLARFVYAKKHLDADGHIKHQAFAPQHNTSTQLLETSVYRTKGAAESYFRRLGKRQGEARNPPKELKAIAHFTVGAVRETKLDVVASPRPHWRHADIVNWPQEKEKQKEIAMLLAQRAQKQASSPA